MFSFLHVLTLNSMRYRYMCFAYISRPTISWVKSRNHASFRISCLLDLSRTIFILSSPLSMCHLSRSCVSPRGVLRLTFIIVLSSGWINAYYACEADLCVSYVPWEGTISLMLCERDMHLLCFERGIPTQRHCFCVFLISLRDPDFLLEAVQSSGLASLVILPPVSRMSPSGASQW